MRVASCHWRVDPDLITALADRLGPPQDAYLNGSHTWFVDLEGGRTLEWRLHPTPGYRIPAGMSPYDLWDALVTQLRGGGDPAGLRLGEETRALGTLWDCLECFVAFGDDLEPAALAAEAGRLLGRAPDAWGLVDHDRIGAAWERSGGRASILDLLRSELRP